MARKRKSSEPKRKQGGQTVYTKVIADKICKLLAAGWTLRRACSEPGMPDERTVRRWALDEEHPFAPQYARAREQGYHAMADEILDMADDCFAEAAAVSKARLRVDTRKWLLSKALPKIYGDKLQHTGEGGGDVQHQHSVEIHIVDHRPVDQD